MVYMYVQRCENSRGSLLLVLRRPRSSEEEEWQDLIEKHFCFCLGLGVCTHLKEVSFTLLPLIAKLYEKLLVCMTSYCFFNCNAVIFQDVRMTMRKTNHHHVPFVAFFFLEQSFEVLLAPLRVLFDPRTSPHEPMTVESEAKE